MRWACGASPQGRTESQAHLVPRVKAVIVVLKLTAFMLAVNVRDMISWQGAVELGVWRWVGHHANPFAGKAARPVATAEPLI